MRVCQTLLRPLAAIVRCGGKGALSMCQDIQLYDRGRVRSSCLFRVIRRRHEYASHLCGLSFWSVGKVTVPFVPPVSREMS